MTTPPDQSPASPSSPGGHQPVGRTPDPTPEPTLHPAPRAGTPTRAGGRPTRVDPRGPRFGAAVTAVLLLVTIALDLQGLHTAALVLLVVLVALFAWGAFAGVGRHPWGVVFQRVVRPRLSPPDELEDAAPPTFAQGVGLLVTGVGLLLALVGVPHAVVVSAAIAFLAAFLNAAFGLCLGRQLYVLLLRAGLVGGRSAAGS